jgi:PRTRC genetic system ThiF family protein
MPKTNASAPQTIEIKRRYRVEIGAPHRYLITLVGCGGTGSFLALHLARLAYHARQRHGLDIGLCFVDPDVVEEKNIGRQNFCPAEIGLNKAHTLAIRYSAAFGLEIHFVERALNADTIPSPGSSFSLVLGAVDNPPARQMLHKICSTFPFWWLDCGNHEHAGQVLLGNRPHLEKPEISPLGFCAGLPLPSVQHPELLAEARPARRAQSCADLALADAQSLMINQAVATYAAQYVYRLILNRDLDIYATYIDLVAGSARSLPIAAEGANG